MFPVCSVTYVPVCTCEASNIRLHRRPRDRVRPRVSRNVGPLTARSCTTILISSGRARSLITVVIWPHGARTFEGHGAGQVSVPAKVRQRLGVGPGSVLEWDEDGDRWSSARQAAIRPKTFIGAVAKLQAANRPK